jgi:hypothetical protein
VRNIVGGLLIALLSGCASVAPVALQTSVVDRPPIGTLQTQEIGDTLLEYFISSTMPSIHTLQQFSIGNVTYEPQIPRPVGVGEKVNRYLLENSSGRQVELCYDPSDSVFFPPNGYGICDFFFKKMISSSPVGVEPATFVDVHRPQFRQELIYNGKIGNSVKFLYREFRGDLIRAPFSQEVQYDLGEGTVIGFKGARIEIVSSSNRSIQYKVLKTFDR